MSIVEYSNQDNMINDLLTIEMIGGSLSPVEVAMLKYYSKDDE